MVLKSQEGVASCIMKDFMHESNAQTQLIHCFQTFTQRVIIIQKSVRKRVELNRERKKLLKEIWNTAQMELFATAIKRKNHDKAA